MGSTTFNDASGAGGTVGSPAPPAPAPPPIETSPLPQRDFDLEPFEPVNDGRINDTGASDVPATVPEGWSELRDNPNIQFEEIPPPPPPEPPEPNWFTDALVSFFGFLGDLFSPVGQLLGVSWPVLQWVLLAAAILFVLYMIARSIGPLSRSARAKKKAVSEPEWQPDHEESVALLEDADQLAAQGKYDEATHLLLQRSVGQISQARPDWVEPSSTARELAALPALSEKARAAFATISERVERSLFALRSLNKGDWEAARDAYANFALAPIDGGNAAERKRVL
ncbi:hypothetical protein [uncultured Erythrobacter sp.]|uniref:hypothetical protein n=1 Tax=uncultured Erythrobacter sp. TaxID=263913 RepID=UPI002635E2F6|nr:hypothetical protein [uncultured Erythrobacter sp.]